MDTAIFSVSYPGVEPYIFDFLNSLSRQTDKDFILFLINDGYHDIGQFLERIDFPVKMREQTGQPAALRKAGIQWIIAEGLEVVIFADADDYFADNRVEISKKMLGEYDVICNEILLVGKKYPQPIPMLEKYFNEGMEIRSKHIVNGNCMGLSNSSIRVDKISPLMTEIPNDAIAFDWTFFALCIQAGARVAFTKNTETYYRQHDDNIASPRTFSEEQILRGVKVKRDHYNLLSKFFDEYVELANGFESLYSRLQSNDLLKDKYCNAVRMNTANALMWWEQIVIPKEIE